MFHYLIRRLLALVPVLLGISLIVFLLVHLVPGDVVSILLGPSTTPQARDALRKLFGLDEPLHIQYINWLQNIAHGDLGRSVRTRQTVVQNVAQRLGPSLELAAVAIYHHLDRMTLDETAEALGCSRRKVAYLLAELREQLSRLENPSDQPIA